MIQLTDYMARQEIDQLTTATFSRYKNYDKILKYTKVLILNCLNEIKNIFHSDFLDGLV